MMSKSQFSVVDAALRAALSQLSIEITDIFKAIVEENSNAKRPAGVGVVVKKDAAGYQKGVVGIESGFFGKLSVGDKLGETIDTEFVTIASEAQIEEAVKKLSAKAVYSILNRIIRQTEKSTKIAAITVGDDNED